MLSLPEARVELAKNGKLLVRVAPSGSLRRLEKALRSAGLAVEMLPAHRIASMRSTDLGRALEALSDWHLDLDDGVTELQASFVDGEGWLASARALVRRVGEDVDMARAMLSDYPGVGVLDPHQVTAVAVASHVDVRGICIFDEQGLGKTIEALFTFDRLRQSGAIERALVLAPKNMILEWARDAERFFPSKYVVRPVVGNEREKRALLDQPADIYVSNFETATTLAARLRSLLVAAHGRGMLIVDESFFVKNSDAKRSQAVRTLRSRAGRCLVLCGTPAPNTARDLVEQFNIADGGIAFRGVDIPEEPELARGIVERVVAERCVYIRRLKGDVLQLPERTFNRVIVRLEPVQRAAYKTAIEGLVRDVSATSELGFRKNLASFMARRIALLQICSNPSSVLDAYVETPAKLLALDDILGEVIGKRGDKVVLWSFFTKSLDAIVTRYAAYNPVRIDGTVTEAAARREAVRRFQDDDKTMLFVGNPAAAGAGITLHRARYAIYESMSNQAAHYLQSLDRVHRRGQTRPVEYLMLLCDETIEVAEYERLLRKEADSQTLLGDRIAAPLTRQGFLSELLGAAHLMGLDQA